MVTQLLTGYGSSRYYRRKVELSPSVEGRFRKRENKTYEHAVLGAKQEQKKFNHHKKPENLNKNIPF